jgi:hypothetical protein
MEGRTADRLVYSGLQKISSLDLPERRLQSPGCDVERIEPVHRHGAHVRGGLCPAFSRACRWGADPKAGQRVQCQGWGMVRRVDRGEEGAVFAGRKPQAGRRISKSSGLAWHLRCAAWTRQGALSAPGRHGRSRCQAQPSRSRGRCGREPMTGKFFLLLARKARSRNGSCTVCAINPERRSSCVLAMR